MKKKYYNGIIDNCASFAIKGMEAIFVLDNNFGKEVLTTKISIDTPNQVYKSATKLAGVKSIRGNPNDFKDRTVDVSYGKLFKVGIGMILFQMKTQKFRKQ